MFEFLRVGIKMLNGVERRRLVTKLMSNGTLTSPEGDVSGWLASMLGHVRELTPNQRRLLIGELDRIGYDSEETGFPAPLFDSVGVLLARAVRECALDLPVDQNPRRTVSVGFATCSGLHVIGARLGLLPGVVLVREDGDLREEVELMSDVGYASHFAGLMNAIGPEWGFNDWRLSSLGTCSEMSAAADVTLYQIEVQASGGRSDEEIAKAIADRTVARLGSVLGSLRQDAVCGWVVPEPGYLDRFTYRPGERLTPCPNLVVLGVARNFSCTVDSVRVEGGDP